MSSYYILYKNNNPQNSLVSGPGNLRPALSPAFSLGDNLLLKVYLLENDGSLSSLSGDSSVDITARIGILGTDEIFVQGSSSPNMDHFLIPLSLNTSNLIDRLSGKRYDKFVLEFRMSSSQENRVIGLVQVVIYDSVYSGTIFPSPSSSYYTKNEADAIFMKQDIQQGLRIRPTRVASFGDSIMVGCYAGGTCTSSLAWIRQFATASRWTHLINNAVSGDETSDQFRYVFSENPSGSACYLVALGTNDMRRADSANILKMSHFASAHLAMLTYLSSVSGSPNTRILFANSSEVSLSPGWVPASPTLSYSIGLSATSSLASASAMLNGRHIGLVYTQRDGNTGSFTVKVDGVTMASVTCSAGISINTIVRHQNHSPGIIWFSNLGDFSHKVEISCSQANANHPVFIDALLTEKSFVPNLGQANHVYVQNIALQGDGAESLRQFYNQIIANNANFLKSIGANVTLVDASGLLRSSDLYDVVHPNTTGHGKLANRWLLYTEMLDGKNYDQYTPGKNPVEFMKPSEQVSVLVGSTGSQYQERYRFTRGGSIIINPRSNPTIARTIENNENVASLDIYQSQTGKAWRIQSYLDDFYLTDVLNTRHIFKSGGSNFLTEFYSPISASAITASAMLPYYTGSGRTIKNGAFLTVRGTDGNLYYIQLYT